jgi:predicted phosphoribosyltransferase
MWTEQPFADLRAAGRKLARELAKRDFQRPVVLALPRGGVPVAYEVACALGAPLELVMVGKIGAPGYEEYAIGAVVDGTHPQLVLDREAARRAGADEAYIARIRAKKLVEIGRRRKEYGAGTIPDLRDRTAILVDDGIATGMTVKAALKGLSGASPSKTVLAVPVAAPSSLRELEPICDEIVCLRSPDPFYAVGSHFDDFGQTSDAEVIALLQLANARRKQGHSS